MSVRRATANRPMQGFWATGFWFDPEREHPVHSAWWSGFLFPVQAGCAVYDFARGYWLVAGILAFAAAVNLSRSYRINRTWAVES